MASLMLTFVAFWRTWRKEQHERKFANTVQDIAYQTLSKKGFLQIPPSEALSQKKSKPWSWTKSSKISVTVPKGCLTGFSHNISAIIAIAMSSPLIQTSIFRLPQVWASFKRKGGELVFRAQKMAGQRVKKLFQTTLNNAVLTTY